ncbi:MAG: acetolactate synthase [Candidatus Methylacidiphilales bacterium]|nr:acetolactate synthase [Candidatus Methylacidiphilales bacterium]
METISGFTPTKVVQFSVFMANKVGRLLEIVKYFDERNVHIVALTIIDSADSSICRIVVDDQQSARAIFEEYNVAYTECTVVVVELPNGAEDMKYVLSALLQAECNVDFTYALLSTPHGKAALAMHVEDEDIASNVLVQNGFTLLSQDDITR